MARKFETPFYHESIRNTIVGFGYLFSGIKIARKNKKTGLIEQTVEVPIAYSQKEKWIHSIEGNPDGEKGIYTNLPRMGFEIVGYSYDSTRKLPRSNKVYCIEGDSRKQVSAPVPYNIDLSLYFATKTQEDGLQILEQILPAFSPDYTLTIMSVSEMNLKQDVPIVLNSVSVSDEYEGDLETRRFVTHELSFTAKINLFSGIQNVGLIKQVEVGMSTPEYDYIASQATPTSPIIETLLGDF